MNIYYVDGKFVPADQATLPVDDLAIVRGIGVFDLLRTYHGKPYFLKEHVTRLLQSARKIKLDLPWSHEQICRVALETLSRNTLAEANIRIIVTGGSSPDFITPAGNPRLLVLVTPLPKLPESWYLQGVGVITLNVRRDNPNAKSINYLPAALALQDARSKGAVEVLYVDDEDNVLEGAISNLFAFIDDKLVTPGQGILSGITRKVILEIAAEYYPIEIRNLPRRELLTAQEAFLTGTNKGLVPVVRIDRTSIGQGVPGKRTRHVMTLLDRYVAGLDD